MDTVTLIIIVLVAAIAYILGRVMSAVSFAHRLKDEREDAAKRSRAVIGGHFAEQLSPYLPGFPYKPTEAKFMGKPIDFIIFQGLDDKKVERVVFLEVKSGGATMSPTERSLQAAIDAGHVAFETYRVPHGVTERREKPRGEQTQQTREGQEAADA